MPRIIAGLYEIKEQIGAGGGGIVYLGRHIRLEKDVVLKADKRRLNTNRDSLRREVDMLKNLRQTYIPQVYDFVEEDGVVYTVMDYIEGESFDKILARNQKITQPDLVKWSCQLLRALSYLHSQPPYGILHGDIKPANIMLRPDGNICLIDYNIALALGEDGAVKVGFSRGYASPEHYGADYIRKSRLAVASKKTKVTDDECDDTDTTLILDSKRAPVQKKEKSILLDARSDIYSLGATLYHIISGKQPAQDAREVESLTENVCSKAIIAIIQKAMNPQPDLRYQSAEEMLQDILALYKNDPRAVQQRRNICISAGVTLVLFLAGITCTFMGLDQMKQREYALVQSEYSANALEDGNVEDAVRYALNALPEEKSILSIPVLPQAQKALTDALGVYDLEEKYIPYSMIMLKSAPFDLTMSPEGKKLAVIYAYEVAVYDLTNDKVLFVGPIQESAYSDVVFSDENTIIYAGTEGITSYDLEKQRVNWVADKGTMICISSNRSRIAVANKDDDYARIYAVSDGQVLLECHFNDRHIQMPVNDIFADGKDSIFSLNNEGSRLAVSLNDGSLLVFEMEDKNPIILCNESEFIHFEGGFCDDYFAYSAYKAGQSIFRLVDIGNQKEIGGYNSQDIYHLKAQDGKIYLTNNNLLVELDPDSLEETELAYIETSSIRNFAVDNDTVVIGTEDQRIVFFDGKAAQTGSLDYNSGCDFIESTENYAVLANRDAPSVRVLKHESHEEAILFTYDSRFEHDEARISMDGQTTMLFNYKHFAIYDREGELVIQTDFPNADSVYDQQFIKDADKSYLEVIWYDGVVRKFDAKTGELISERMETAPAKDLYEEFYTEQYKIRSSLHDAAEVYDIKNGKKITSLERDSYLTYVTQVSEGLITEYVHSNGERYGLLLDQNLETIAYLPDLCDMTDEYLVFDDNSGNLRKSPIYTLEELTQLGENLLSEKKSKEEQ